MSDETLQKLIDMISTASPVVWEATLRRVYVVVIADLIWGVIFCLCGYKLSKLIGNKKQEWEVEEPALLVISYLGTGTLFLIGGLIITSGLMWLGSPTYSAIWFLLNTP